jgi:glycosyltransferase involved in cell wall biosynthesis
VDLSQHGDRLIAIRTPAYLLRHPHKVLWFIHHYRGAYDLWYTRYRDIPDTPEGLRHRDAVLRADNVTLREARRIFANSSVVAGRLKRYNGVESEVLYPPLLAPEDYRCSGFGDYVLYVSRLTHHKRQWLAIEALRHTRTPVKLVIAGMPDAGEEAYAEGLRALAEKYRLSDRIVMAPRWISEQEKIALFAECLAAIYIPLDEDSYGFPTLEAHHSGKLVISTTDAGATRELIVDGLNGFLTSPDPEDLAGVMDRLYLDRGLARRMGEAGRRRVEELGITWDKVIERLLG